MKAIAYLASVAMLAGCATAKPDLPDNQYAVFATEIVSIHRCAINGHLTSDEAVLGWRHVRARLDTWSYDPSRMKNTLDALSGAATPSREWCVTAAITIASNKEQSAERHETTSESLMRPRHTFCNQVGNQTLCSTY